MMQSLDLFLKSKRYEGLTEKSIKSYGDILRPFCRYCDCDISVLTLDQVYSYFDSVLSKGLSKATYSTYCRNVKVFLRFCHDKGFTDIDYEQITVPKSPRRAVRLLTPDDIKGMLGSVSAQDYTLQLRNCAVLALMFDSGLRQAEVCRLRVEDIRFSERYAIVRGKGDKERYAPLGSMVLSYLSSYVAVRPASDCPFFFLDAHGAAMTENAVKLFVHRLSKRIGIDFTSHKLRHNFATNYCIDSYEKDGQVDIYKLMHLMGHENIKTTEIYLHFALDIIAARNHFSHLDMLEIDKKNKP